MNRRRFVHSLLAGSAFAAAPLAAEAQSVLSEPQTQPKKRKKAMPALFPAGLGKGSTVGIVAPASGVTPDEIKGGIKSLESLGCTVVLGKSIYRGSAGYLAAPDEVRASEFMEFIRRKDIDAIVCARGGYGVMRMLHLIDFDEICRHPKIIMGYSDITVLLNAIFQRCNLVTFHGPVAAGEFDEFTRDSVVKTLFTENYLSDTSLPLDTPTTPLDSTQTAKLTTKHTKFSKDKSAKDKQEKLRTAKILPDDSIIYTDSLLSTIGKGGVAQGQLVGGNLTMICSTLGTPFEVDTRGKIVFLEDVNEEPYRIDRMLTQLWLAGKLQVAAGIVLGKFQRSEPSGEFLPSYSLEEVFRTRLEPLQIPVVSNFQFGHVRTKLTLPVGALAELHADNKTLSIVEKPVIG
jgi:muramoyltetrapeptide carboxypeptidase